MASNTTELAKFGPATSKPKELAPADPRVLLAALASGVALDLAVHRQLASVATSALVVVVGVGLLLSRRLRSSESKLLLVGAIVFGLWASLRASPWLVPLNVGAATTLLVLAASVSRDGEILGRNIRDWARQIPAMLGAVVGAIPFLSTMAGHVAHARRRATAVSVGMGLLLAAPIVAVLVALLASGDALTAAALGAVRNAGVVDHVFVTALGIVAGAALLFRAACPDDEPAPDTQRFLGTTEALVVLSCVTAVFGGFAAIQIAGALGAAGHVLDSPTETSQWAREGFFQLLWASGITLAVLLIVDALTHRTHPRSQRFLGRLSATAALLAVFVVASAIMRIVAYSQTFGLTMLRLYSGLFALWIGAVFVLHSLRVLRPHRWERWFTTGSAAAGLAILMGLNVVNPEPLVVRFDTADEARADAAYLSTDLSNDAVPSLIASLDSLQPSVARRISEELCRRPLPGPDGLLSWNWGRSRAREALEQFC